MLSEAIAGNLDDVDYYKEPIFGLSIPTTVKGVPSDVLIPRNTWKDKDAYDIRANKLADMFAENFKKFKSKAAKEVLAAGPEQM